MFVQYIYILVVHVFVQSILEDRSQDHSSPIVDCTIVDHHQLYEPEIVRYGWEKL